MLLLNEEKVKVFLAKNNITNYDLRKVAGDASFRSYYRIFCGKKNFILMFAPPKYEDIAPFIKIDEFLIAQGFSAPKIFAIDFENGFILLEDFGDDTYGRILQQNNSSIDEFDLYKKACDCLIQIHKVKETPKNIALYDNSILLREVMLFVDWYLPSIKNINLTINQIAEYKRLWFEIFDLLNRDNPVLVLRDYHADNLMLLLEKSEYQSVGLLDFQDALLGSNAYDLVSLLEDARRDVLPEIRERIFEYYLENSGVDKESFLLNYAILSLQRNIKIIGIFSRLAVRDSKPHYLNLLPRVINFVKMRLSNNKEFVEIANFLSPFI